MSTKKSIPKHKVLTGNPAKMVRIVVSLPRLHKLFLECDAKLTGCSESEVVRRSLSTRFEGLYEKLDEANQLDASLLKFWQQGGHRNAVNTKN